MSTRPIRKILIAGAPTGCWTNAGDEAILASMVSALSSRMSTEITVVSSNPDGFLSRFGVGEVPYHDINRVIELANASDLMILGGGSIFFDYTGFDPGRILTNRHEALSFVTGFALLAGLLEKPLMMYSVGVGPLATEAGRLFTRAAFEQADIVSLRDPMSRTTLESLGYDTAEVRITADPVFDFKPAHPSTAQSILKSLAGAKLRQPVVGVALREWGMTTGPAEWEPYVAATLDSFIRKNSGTIIFVPCHRTVDWPLTDDPGTARRVRDLMRCGENAFILESQPGPAELASVFGACEIVVGMRLHSIIFALESSVPVIALNCDPKISSLMSYLGRDEWLIELADLHSNRFATTLDRVFRDRLQLRRSLSTKISEMADLARENATLAEQLMLEGPRPKPIAKERAVKLLRGTEAQALLSSNSILLRNNNAAKLQEDPSHETPHQGTDSSPSDIARGVKNSARIEDSSHPNKRPIRSFEEGRRVACLTNRLLDWETRAPRFGGAERYALTLGTLLSELGLDVTFFQAGNSAFEGEYFGFKVVALPPGEWVSEFAVGVSNEFYRASLDFDHVIYLMPNFASGKMRNDALMVCHDIWFDHNQTKPPITFRTDEWFEQLHRAFSQPQRIVSVDTNSINFIRALWPDLASRMTYVPNWVDTSQFHPPRHRDSSQLTVLFPRRSEIVRGAGMLGEILSRIPYDCRFLWWLGEGTNEATEIVKSVAAKDPRLEFYSVPSYDEMPGIYRKSDICVIPTIASEATSLACLEGLASGCAVVATNVGGLPNLVQPGVNGLLVDPRPEEISAAVNLLIDDPSERRRLQIAGRQTALGFDIEVWRKRWTNLLEDLGWISAVNAARAAISEDTDDRFGDGSVEHRIDGEHSEAVALRDNLYDVICFSIIDWEFRYQRPQQIMTELADRGHRVFYLSISRFLPLGPHRLELTRIRENIWEVRLGLPQALELYGDGLPEELVPHVIEGLRALRNDLYITNAVSVVQFPSWAPVSYAARDKFGWSVWYDCMDNWSNFPGFESKHRLLSQECELVEAADLLVVSSNSLHQKWEKLNSNIVLARNGADFAHFGGEGQSEALASEKHPIVGYFGAIADWFDLELILRLAKERPDFTLVLVGEVFDLGIEELQALPNVRLTGAQPYERMPDFLRGFDVCLVPFLINRATDSMDVVKFYEYISQGKPVVATRIKELLGYDDYLYLADDHDDFIRKVDLAVAEDDAALRAKRIALARDNTWSARVDAIKEGIEHGRRHALAQRVQNMIDAGMLAPKSPNAIEGNLSAELLAVSSLLLERDQAADILRSQANEQRAEIRALAGRIDRLYDQIADDRQQLETRDAKIAEIESQNQELAKQLSDQTGELAKTTNALREKEGTAEILSTQLAAKEAELNKITNSLGWRLLSRYGRIKYRYLLPLYRVFESKPAPAQEPPVETVPEPQPLFADLPQKYDIICFPIIDWDFRFQRPQQILTRFAAAGHRVFYVRTVLNGESSRIKVRELAKRIYDIKLPGPTYLNLYTQEMPADVVESIARAFDELHGEARMHEVVCLVQLPFWTPLAFSLRERWGSRVIYDCMDEHSEFSTTSESMHRQEDYLLKESDLVLATSSALFEKASGTARRLLLLPNAADFEHFNNPAQFRPLSEMEKPIIGYYGAISDWFDIEMIKQAATARPDWTFVLIGSTFGADTSPLHDLSNVHLLGEQPYISLPGYLQEFDVATIPFLRNGLTEATNPVKFYEYLSAGKPVVATELPELEPFEQYYYPIRSRTEFLGQLEAALDENSREKVDSRIRFARDNTWEQRHLALETQIQQLYPRAAIVIVSFKNLLYLRLCLESIWKKTLYPNYEVIVVDNGGQRDIVEYLKNAAEEEPRLKVIFNDRNLGFAAANNIGIRAAEGCDSIVLLNDDTIVTPGWLGSLLRYLDTTEIGLIGPVTNWAGNEARVDVDYSRIEELDEFAARYAKDHADKSFDIPMLAMYCVAMRKELLDRIGLLDEQFGIGMFEDDDFALRVKEAGYRVVCAEDIFIHHWGRASFGKIDQESYDKLFDENRRKFEAKWKSVWVPHKSR